MLIFAAETGARQGDVLRMPWSAYDGNRLRFTPSKSITKKKPRGRPVAVPISDRLQMVIESLPRVSTIMLTNRCGRPWQGNSFRKAWEATAIKAGIVDLHFNDLRGTAVTRLSEAGCTPQEIATFTGWSLAQVHRILDRYLARTDKLASTALAKLERARK
jgi:integrase